MTIKLSKSRNLKLTLSYDGSAYVGWQLQKTGISIQQKVEEILKKIHGTRVVVHGASRTDCGVHALAMVASFQWSKDALGPASLLRAFNALLPDDIRVIRIQRAKSSFHARFSAKTKLYRYRILNRSVADPFRRHFVWHLYKSLNLHAMKRAASFFVGKKNCSSIAVNPGYERTTMVRHIYRCQVLQRGDEIHIEVEGDGFLYKMVRTMVGTLVEVGNGKRSPESVEELLKARDRSLAGVTAPAHGLYLVKVKY